MGNLKMVLLEVKKKEIDMKYFLDIKIIHRQFYIKSIISHKLIQNKDSNGGFLRVNDGYSPRFSK